MKVTIKKGDRAFRSSIGLLASGACTINVHQRMNIARKAASKDSLKGDWIAVGKDLRYAIDNVKRDLESA
jgi:hypothetical protein